MKIKVLISIWVVFQALVSFSQSPRPSNWDTIIQQPWYFGTVFNKPAFLYLAEDDPATGYFFAATTAIPYVYQLQIKWKQGSPRSIAFRKEDKKIRAKFTGSVNDDTISGFILTSRKNAIRLGIIPEIKLFMVKEPPCLHASMPPCLPAPLPPRYLSPIFNNIGMLEEISYGAANGYYSSMPLETEGYDYQQIILDAMEKMYVDPTKEALLHLLNKDPLSFALTDLQALRLDIYQPVRDTLRKRPLILMLHGGAFILGDKASETTRALANDFAQKGYVVAAINYRMGFNLASKSSLERSAYRAVQDARAALRFLSYHAATYRIDPNYIFLAGSSAGAITALNAAFMDEDERPESAGGNLWRFQKDLGGLDESTNTFQSPYTVRAVVNLWGAVGDTNMLDAEETIPVLSIHGDADRIVPYACAYPFLDIDTTLTGNTVSKLYGSLPIHQRLTHLGIHSELVVLPNAGHEPQYEPGKYAAVMETISTRTTEFFFKSLFGFPEITGPRQIAIGTSPSTYTLPETNDVTYYWQVTGGKIIPGAAKNMARVVWLANGSGKISLVMVHRNMASVEIDLPVELP